MANQWTTASKVREAVAKGARLRRRAWLWTAFAVALATSGATWLALAAWSGGVALGGAALIAGATVPAIQAYWASRGVSREERRVVEVVTSFAARGASTERVADRPRRPGPRSEVATSWRKARVSERLGLLSAGVEERP